MAKSKSAKSQNFLDAMEPAEALEILKSLSKSDSNIKNQINELFVDQIEEVDRESIAADLLSDLDFIDIEDVWDTSGVARNGCTDPVDAAWEVMEEAVEPYIKEMERYHSLKMFSEEMHYCMGLISALHEFENESDSEFKDQAPDAPLSIAEDILSKWKKSCKDPELLQTMENFVEKLS
jgi:hypothetical protein